MNDLIIRRARAEDLDACFDLEHTCFPPAEAAPLESIEKRIREFPQGFLVAELKGRIVGHVNAGATDKEDISDEAFKALIGHKKDGKNMVIFSVATLPELQKNGIAGKLLIRFIEESRKQSRNKVLLICKTPLIDYYAKFGFKYLRESDSDHGGAAWHEMGIDLDGSR